MFSSYVKIAFRNLYRKKFYSFINIFGLGTAIAICIAGYINYQFSQSFDEFHKNRENIYLITTLRDVNNGHVELCNSPTPLIPESKDKIPGIDTYTRLARSNGILRYEDKVFNENISYVDENFFNIFTFPMLKGERSALMNKDHIFITDEIAAKYFGRENPVGKQVLLNPTGGKEYSFFVGGVIKKPSTNSSLSLSVIVHYERQIDMLGYNLEAWNDWTSAAFILINNQASLAGIKEQLNGYVKKQNEANPGFAASAFNLVAFTELSVRTRDLSNMPFRNSFHLSQIIAPSVIALLVLLLACFNFINTAIAYSSSRLKEIGIRKVIGGMRSQLIKQFMGENLILCLFALVIGMAFAGPVVAFYDGLFPENHFTLSYMDNPGVLVFIVVLLVFTAVAAAAYPAFYISKFNPVKIFRGRQTLGGTNRLIRILLTLQFSIAISAILSGIVLYMNGKFIENFDLGFEKEQLLIVPVTGEDNYSLFKGRIENLPGIISISGSNHLVGRDWTTRDVEIDKEISRITVLDMGENYMETVGLELIQGKAFDNNVQADAEQSVLINETMAARFGPACEIGKFIKFQYPAPGREYRIAGILKDFYLNGVWREIPPIVFRYSPPQDYRYMSIKFNLSSLRAVSDGVKQTWKTLFPHLPYDGFYMTEIMEETIQITAAIKKMFFYIALIVLLTSGLGLLAIVSLNIVKRTKEIGIRRVLGASFTDIGYIISKEFILLLVIAGAAGCLMGYFMVEALLSSIWAYYVGIGLMPFLLSIFIMFALAMLTIGSQVFTVTKDNPTNSLRYE